MLIAKVVILPDKYLNYINVFLNNSKIKLLKQTNFNKYIIKKLKNKQLLYRPIYNLKLIKFKTLKIYIETNLVNNFIKFLELFISISILFV